MPKKEKLRTIIKDKHRTFGAFGLLIGTKPQTLSKLLGGQLEFSPNRRKQWALALKIPNTDEYFGGIRKKGVGSGKICTRCKKRQVGKDKHFFCDICHKVVSNLYL